MFRSLLERGFLKGCFAASVVAPQAKEARSLEVHVTDFAGERSLKCGNLVNRPCAIEGDDRFIRKMLHCLFQSFDNPFPMCCSIKLIARLL
ncbi:hypothetical protein NBEOAGPD_2269 [Methylobacterium gregans]|uniref:Uncharacterized protein n=1 Tax=Methylobacterium gregans TaxID=374424 RepID=A0AA37MBP7_9HYPH|nr:hypothetical protein NBEOAGPD_2269 [Methylobacterium gregans]